MHRSNARGLALATALLAAGCDDLTHSNPFDPETPVADQAKARLAGTVTLEALGGGAPALAGVDVSVTGARATRTAVTDSTGAWTASEVPAGVYVVRASRSGYREESILGVTVLLDDGGTTVVVPPLALSAIRGGILGRVALVLPDSTQETTGGAVVTVHGLSESAITAGDGSFALASVPVGSHTLEATRLGYRAGTLTAVVTDEGFATVGEVRLDSDPGWLAGSVVVVGGAVGPDQALVRARGTTLGGTPYEGSAHPSPADGSYLVSNLPAGTYSVTYELVDHAMVSTAAAVAPAAGTDLPPVSLIRESGSVLGVARLEGMGDHAGIQVSLTPWPKSAGSLPVAAALTDGTGNWRVDLLPVGIYAIDYVKAPGFAPGTGTVTATARTPVTATPVTLAAIPGMMRGSAFFEGGTPGGFAGTTVRVEGATALTTVTLPDGSWSLTGVGAGTHTVVFERTDHASQRAQVVTAPGGDVTLFDVTLPISRGGLAGIFTLSGSASSAGIVVTAAKAGQSSSTVTDGSGAWSLDGLPVGVWTVTARLDPNWQPRTGLAATVAPSLTSTLATLPLSPIASAAVSGVAVLEGGADPRGITVRLTGSDFRGQGVSLTTSPTALDGTYSLAGLVAGSYQLAFGLAGFDTPAPVGVSISTGQATSLGRLSLAASRGAATGTATATGAASQAGTVVTVSGGPDTASGVTDGSGRWTIDRLRIGTGYVATFTRPDYASTSSPAFPVSGGEVTTVPAATLVLATTGSISGVATVARPSGSNGGIDVALAGADVNGGVVTRAASTSPTGAYAFSGLPSGSYGLTIARAGYDAQAMVGLTVTGTAVVAPPVTLQVSTGAIAGQIGLSAGAIPGFPVGTDFSGAVVTLGGTDVPVPAAVSDAAGTYRFTDVPVSLGGGQFTVTARKAGFVQASTAVTGVADSTVTVPTTLTLVVNAATLAGTTLLWDDAGGAGANPTSAGVAVSVTGTAFNGVAYSAGGASGAGGGWSVGPLPPGRYDVLATSANRTCADFATATVPEGATTTIPGSVRCTDALAPGALALGLATPPAGGSAGHVQSTSASLPVTAGATDATAPATNFRGYQVAVGAAPNWASAPVVAAIPGAATTLPVTGLAANAISTVQVRAVDWVGNAGPASATTVVSDGIVPPTPSISTPRSWVDATTSSVTISGGEADANFDGYQVCTLDQAATTACAPCTCSASATACSCSSGGSSCGFASSTSTFALSLAAGRRTCVWARAVDRAGNAGGLAATSVVSDLSLPTPPRLAPNYDPFQLTVRAPWVDFMVTGAATDATAGGGDWQGIAHVELDTGAGFQPVCPQAACSASGAWAPCGACACTDDRLRCDGTTLKGFRAALTEGTSNTIAVRAVDRAGNVGPGVAQQVTADATAQIVAGTIASEMIPNVRGTLVGYYAQIPAVQYAGMIVDLGADRRPDADDPRCEVGSSIATGLDRGVVPAHQGLVAVAEYGAIRLRRPGPDGAWCTADDVATVVATAGASTAFNAVVAVGERMAWVERNTTTDTSIIRVREAGADGLVGTADDVVAALGPFNSMSHSDSGISMGERAILYAAATCPTCTSSAWHVINASPSGSFASGTTAMDLPATATLAALSSDSARVAWYDAGSLWLRTTGGNLSFEAGDPTVQVAYPSSGAPSGMALEGNHVVLTEYGTGNHLAHWASGVDGTFGTADDVQEAIRPSSSPRVSPSLSGSLLTYSSDYRDILALDLSVLRWDIVGPVPLASYGSVLASEGSGTTFYRPESAGITARTAAGSETVGPAHDFFAVTGSDLVSGANFDGIWVYDPDPATGRYFAGAAPSARVYSNPGASYYLGVAAGGGKALVVENVAGVAHTKVIDPRGGLLRNAATGGAVVDVYPVGENSNWARAWGVTARQAFFTCDDINTRLCVYDAGPDLAFGAGADDTPATFMLHATGSPVAGTHFDGPSLAVSGRRLVVADQAGVHLRDAGADGVFNTADDRERRLSTNTGLYQGTFAVAGDWVAFLDAGVPGGNQVQLVNGFDGPVLTVTSHYSAKRALTLEPSGRVRWVDGLFTPDAVFVYVP